MLYVVDSSVLIDHLRGVGPAVTRLRDTAAGGDELWSVSPVRTEILAGARSSEEGAIDALFDRLRWLEVTVELADAAGHVAAAFIRSHPGVDTVDYMIAAGVQQLGAELLTLNVRHFPMFPALKPAY